MEVQACAACRFQRRRCSPACPLAKYFPASENQRFMNCKKLFGVSNMLRLLNQVLVKDRDETMQSLMFEADVREQDPVHGCMGIICMLEQQLDKLRRELAVVREQLRFFQAQEQQQQHNHNHHLRHQQQQQQQEVPGVIDHHGLINLMSSTNVDGSGGEDFGNGGHSNDHLGARHHQQQLLDDRQQQQLVVQHSSSSSSAAASSSTVMNAATAAAAAASFHYCFI
ncbi:LOB domain-containing protein 22 [Selaginella moellendorffii]|uniref:LOB domain-containing protein 22 n=1 Tax=Selaginella moellendorffii TaxID=88036 RepID=UPI000D1C2233|nr:LOB domain-containing protein 22 [Selaginella moellendorffii]|eukprot:XP_024533779.1 LOB domain-containing protein 22 [Selaginella moellendorffii]